jgi:hypothetical protein
VTVIDDRLAQLDRLVLAHGSHRSFDEGVCAMEAAAWIAGEEHTDRPSCVSPVIAAFMRSWNDRLNDDARNRLLKPLIPLTVGTATSRSDDETRAWMATDWLARECAPAFLRLAGLTDQAQLLENLAALTGRDDAITAQPILNDASKSAAAARAAAARRAWDAAGAAARAAAARRAWDAARRAWDAAWDAARRARDAARAAARDAARAAARDAARAAAWDAARAAARDAARAAAWDAAWDAAGAAARDAAWDALQPAVEILQPSAVDLVKRMCEVGRS